jgi:DNA polymerase III alpha subunit
MMFLTLEDLSGALDVVLFPQAYRQAQSALNANTPIFVTGVIEMDASRGEPFLNAEKVVRVK